MFAINNIEGVQQGWQEVAQQQHRYDAIEFLKAGMVAGGGLEHKGQQGHQHTKYNSIVSNQSVGFFHRAMLSGESGI